MYIQYTFILNIKEFYFIEYTMQIKMMMGVSNSNNYFFIINNFICI